MKRHTMTGLAAPFAGLILLACSALIPAVARPAYQDTDNAVAAADSGPVRLAWFSSVIGDVTWRPDDQAAWSEAVRNLPLRQGAQISAARGTRAEVQFDDGSRLWMANGAVVTLRSLYSDADGEFTEIVVQGGTVGLAPRNEHSVYQVDTPLVSVDAAGPSRFRVDAIEGVQVRDREGQVTVQGSPGKVTLNPGDYLDLRTDQDPYEIRNIPPADDFDDWTASLYQREEQYLQSPNRAYVPDNVAIVSDELEVYGTWQTVPTYGMVWCPRDQPAGWRPYHDGHWVWVAPFGWTWVAKEPWGWAPYHYGSWIHVAHGWAWVPGPRQQYWSPATVTFYEFDGNILWCPLAPAEVHYPPTFAVGYRHGNWARFFSIGAAAVYYPTPQGYCVPRPWSSHYINHAVYASNVTNSNNYYGGSLINHNRPFSKPGYIPINCRDAAGASLVRREAFGGRGAYRPLPRGANPAFVRGRVIGAPTGGFASFAGPPAARLTPMALSPTRNLRQENPVPPPVLARPVYHAPGAPANRFAVEQARSLNSAPIVRRAPNTPAAPQRLPAPTQPNVPTSRVAAPFSPPTPRPSATTRFSSERPSVIRARAPLGRPTGAVSTYSDPKLPQPRATSTPPRPIQSQPGLLPAPGQEAARRARATIGAPTATGAVTPPNNGIPRRPGNDAIYPPRQIQMRPAPTPPPAIPRNNPPLYQQPTPRIYQQQPSPRIAPPPRIVPTPQPLPAPKPPAPAPKPKKG